MLKYSPKLLELSLIYIKIIITISKYKVNTSYIVTYPASTSPYGQKDRESACELVASATGSNIYTLTYIKSLNCI